MSEIIDLTLIDEETINLVILDEGAGVTTLRTLTHVLSQIDIDNKYITKSELASVAVKDSVLVFVDECGIKLQNGTDYIIDNENRITWNGYEAEELLSVGDTIKVYF